MLVRAPTASGHVGSKGSRLPADGDMRVRDERIDPPERFGHLEVGPLGCRCHEIVVEIDVRPPSDAAVSRPVMRTPRFVQHREDRATRDRAAPPAAATADAARCWMSCTEAARWR